MSYTLKYTGAQIDGLLDKINNVFIAAYGSTLYSAITGAIAAENEVIAVKDSQVFTYVGKDANNSYVFAQGGPDSTAPVQSFIVCASDGTWSAASTQLATVEQFYASLMEDTASGSIASFPDGAEGVPVKELTADIEPIQDLHGQARPWPAGGNVQMIPDGTNTANGFVSQHYLNDEGNAISNTSYNISEYFPMTAGETYTWSGPTAAQAPSLGFYDASKNYISGIRASAALPKTFTAPTGTAYCRVSQTNSAFNPDTFMQVEQGSTATTPRVPYKNICPIYSQAEKNLLPPKLYQYSANRVDFGVDNTTDSIPIKAGTYTIKYYASSVLGTIYYNTGGGNISLGNVNPATFTLAADGVIRIWVYNNSGVSASAISAVQLEAGSVATPYVPYRCVTRVDVEGKNLFDKNNLLAGAFTTNHVFAPNSQVNTAKIKVNPNDIVTISGMKNWGQGYINCFTDAELNYISTVGSRTSAGGFADNVTVTVPSNAVYLCVECYIGAGDYELYRDEDTIQVELGSTATAYEAFKDRTYFSIAGEDIPSEVYGGELNVTTGELKVTDASESVSSGFTAHSSNRWYHNGLPTGADYSKRTQAICNQATYEDASNTYRPIFAFGASGIYVNKLTADETIEAFEARIAATPLQFVYPITPQTYYLDPVEVKTWLATNNIVCNTGKIKLVVYRCNTALYIEKELGE